MVKILVGTHVQRYATIWLRMFGSIRQQVEDDAVESLGIRPSHHAFRLAVDGEFQMLANHQRLDVMGRLNDELDDVNVADEQLWTSMFYLAGFQQLL